MAPMITKYLKLKWRNPHLYKLYGYGLCKVPKTHPKIAEHKVQHLHFRYLKFLVIPQLSNLPKEPFKRRLGPKKPII